MKSLFAENTSEVPITIAILEQLLLILLLFLKILIEDINEIQCSLFWFFYLCPSNCTSHYSLKCKFSLYKSSNVAQGNEEKNPVKKIRKVIER